MTKCELYEKVNDIRKIFGIHLTDYPINILPYIENTIEIQRYPFHTPGLRGMAFTENLNRPLIILNSNLSMRESNFYCGHELIHVLLHPSKNNTTFTCYDSIRPQQNFFLEWQANEGSAEFLVPYKLLLPIIKRNYNKLLNHESFEKYQQFRHELATAFHVTDTVIELRLQSLKYEIHQYVNCDVPLNELQILSNKQQERQGIYIESLVDRENKLLDQEFEKIWAAC